MDRKWTALLFKKFSNIYLEKWSEKFSDVKLLEAHLDEWSIGLKGLTAKQVECGIDYCRIHTIWPPSISEFIIFAKGNKSPIHHGDAYKDWHALPKPLVNLVIAKTSIEHIRLLL